MSNVNPTIAIKLKPAADRMVKKRHPWIFADSIVKQSRTAEPGDSVVVFDRKNNKFLALGLYDPDSPIRVKLLSWQNGQKIDQEFFNQRVHDAYLLRTDIVHNHTNAYRLIFGENDGLPGLICDVYDHVLVVKIYTRIWIPYLPMLQQAILNVCACSAIVIRLSRLVTKTNLDPAIKEGRLLYGVLESEEIVIKEHGVLFQVNVIKGHKTGFFLDHRHNRLKVQKLSKGKSVLDVFSYAGGFSVHALVGGAVSTTSLDISEQALELAVRNAKLNKPLKGRHHTICGDAFKELERLVISKTTYDVVIIDPPAFAKSAKESPFALTKYKLLAKLGAKLTEKNGILILASCSARVSNVDFFITSMEGIKTTGKSFHLIEKTFHDLDHPISFTEGAYLKCGYFHIN